MDHTLQSRVLARPPSRITDWFLSMYRRFFLGFYVNRENMVHIPFRTRVRTRSRRSLQIFFLNLLLFSSHDIGAVFMILFLWYYVTSLFVSSLTLTNAYFQSLSPVSVSASCYTSPAISPLASFLFRRFRC